jgi:hypothetical protein
MSSQSAAMATNLATLLADPVFRRFRFQPTDTPDLAALPPSYSLENFLGRWVELADGPSGGGLTLAAALSAAAHRSGQLVAWITLGTRLPFVTDLESWGIDLLALPIVRVQNVQQAGRCTHHLLHSAAFALVVVDLGVQAAWSLPVQSKLAKLAQQNDAALVVLTEKKPNEASMSSMVSIRGQVSVQRQAWDRFECSVEILKDKRRGPGWMHREFAHGPLGLH